MTLYEVNLEVEQRIREEFLIWLRGHIDEMLDLPGFMKAELEEVLADYGDKSSRSDFSVRYHLEDQQALDNYLSYYSAVMRSHVQERFAGQFRVWCRVLTPLY